MLDHLASRSTRFNRRKVKHLRDSRPVAYLHNTKRPLYQGGGNVGGNARYSETRKRENFHAERDLL